MRRIIVNMLMIFAVTSIYGQVTSTDTTTNEPMNTAQNILAGNGGKTITVAALVCTLPCVSVWGTL